MDGNAGELTQYIKLISQFLELYKFNLPGTLLLSSNCLQSNSSIAVAAATIMKNNVNFLHGAHCVTAQPVPEKSTLHAMWITFEVPCVQPVPWPHSPRIRVPFID